MCQPVVYSAAAAMLIAATSFPIVHAQQDSKPPKGAPEYQAPPRSGDGRFMALTVQKLETGFDPQRPLLIWAVGSSFTNGLGNGDLLIELVRQRFPAAPEIVYNPPRDRCPHAVSLGKNLLPQKWTVTMTSDTCDYELVGSATGPDGKGNALAPFTSDSGQILIEPEFWRDARNNRAGDRFEFEVIRSAVGSVSFKASSRVKFRLRLATGLSNPPHVLKLVARGDGLVTVDALDVFEPPLK